jgi:hypothetical protein
LVDIPEIAEEMGKIVSLYSKSNFPTMKRILYLLLLLLPALGAGAQPKAQAHLGVDLVSSYVWCGQKLDGASVQPSLSVSYRGFQLEGWGSVGLDSDSRAGEFDLFLSYRARRFSFTLIDYWLEYVHHQTRAKYFHLGAHSAQSSHIYNVKVGYDFGPVVATVNTNVGGKDSRTSSDRRAYSTYFNVSAPFALGGLQWTALVGGTPFATAYYEANRFAITELKLAATKRLPLTSRFQLPLTVALIANPRTEKVYFTAKVGI